MKWKTKILSTALALALVVPTVAFGTDAGTNTSEPLGKGCFPLEQRVNLKQHQMSQEKMLEIVAQYTPESLSEWQNVLTKQEELAKELRDKAPGMGRKGQLTNEQQEKIQAIQEQVKNGSLTQEQAREELSKLGLDQPGRRINPKDSLTDEQKEKIQAIQEQVKNGSLTQEQAREELSKLGLDQPGRRINPKDSLTDEQKEKIQAIQEQVKNGSLTQEQAREELSKLGLDQPGRRINPKDSLTDEQKEKIQAIQEQVKNGQLTLEQAQAELSQLGINDLGKHFRLENRQAGTSNGIIKELLEAVEANDEAKIKEKLPQLLTQMQEKVQSLATRLSE